MDQTVVDTRKLEEALCEFEQSNPQVVEALRVMNIPFDQYLQALASMREAASTSGSAIQG